MHYQLDEVEPEGNYIGILMVLISSHVVPTQGHNEALQFDLDPIKL